MPRPEVSVLMPTYNRAPTIAAAVESVFKQTYADWRLIIYDDGSDNDDGYRTVKKEWKRVSEPTVQMLKKYLKDPRVEFHRNNRNQGIAKARNALLDLCNTEYACWLDSDDRSNVYRLEFLVDVMERHQPSYVRTAKMTYANLSDQTWMFPPVLLWRGGPCVASVMFRPADAPKYDERFSVCCEDMDWECHLAWKNGKGMQAPLTLYCVGRRTPGRLSMQYKEEDVEREYARCKRLYESTSASWVEKMRARGYEKKPTPVPWEMIAEYLKRWYGKYHK